MVRIYTLIFNRPDLIEWQLRTIKTFILDKTEYIPVINTEDPGIMSRAVAECERLRIRYETIMNPDYHTPNNAHSYGINQVLERFITRDNEHISVILDCDMFFIKPICIADYVRDYEFTGISQGRANAAGEFFKYIHLGFLIINHLAIPDRFARIRELSLKCGFVGGIGLDTGGMFYYYLQEYPETKVKWLSTNLLNKDRDFRQVFGEMTNKYYKEFSSEFVDDVVFHYRCGSNWDHKSKDTHRRKTLFLKEMLENKIQAYDKISK